MQHVHQELKMLFFSSLKELALPSFIISQKPVRTLLFYRTKYQQNKKTYRHIFQCLCVIPLELKRPFSFKSLCLHCTTYLSEHFCLSQWYPPGMTVIFPVDPYLALQLVLTSVVISLFSLIMVEEAVNSVVPFKYVYHEFQGARMGKLFQFLE